MNNTNRNVTLIMLLIFVFNIANAKTITCSKHISDLSVDTIYKKELSRLTGLPVGPDFLYQRLNLGTPILRPFNTDGCSTSPDGLLLGEDAKIWQKCCIEHDKAYWIGGSKELKMNADQQLEQCISRTGHANIGALYHQSVAIFGGPDSKKTYRWGYGWNMPKAYQTLADTELQQVRVLQDTMMETEITSNCDQYDISFNHKISGEEEIYQYLNEELRRNDQIEWAILKHFNHEKKYFQIKLKRQDKSFTLIFSKLTKQVQQSDDF